MPPYSPSEVLAEIQTALEVLGDFLSPGRLLEAWQIKGAKAPGWRYAQISAAVVLGDASQIERLLFDAELAECRRPDKVCEQFRFFERRVHEYLAGKKRDLQTGA